MKKALIIVGVGVIIAVMVGYSLYNKQHRSVEKEAAIEVSASDLFAEYEANELEANKKYLDQALAVTGVVSEISTNQDGKPVIILGTNDPLFGIQCTLAGEIQNVKVGNTITIKGICTGYLSDVVITAGILLQANTPT